MYVDGIGVRVVVFGGAVGQEKVIYIVVQSAFEMRAKAVISAQLHIGVYGIQIIACVKRIYPRCGFFEPVGPCAIFSLQ